MRTEHALRVVKNFRRYRVCKNGKTQWYQAGPYVPQQLIPAVTKRQSAALNRMMGSTKGKQGAIRWVDVDRIRSTQRCLRFKSLMWNVRNHEKMQKTFGGKRTDMDIRGVNLPIIAWVGGVPIIWNGNHRVTANMLLGKKRILVRMFKLRR